MAIEQRQCLPAVDAVNPIQIGQVVIKPLGIVHSLAAAYIFEIFDQGIVRDISGLDHAGFVAVPLF